MYCSSVSLILTTLTILLILLVRMGDDKRPTEELREGRELGTGI